MILHRRASPSRPGLTLMELIVVLTILVALAGILIPLLPNMVTRAHNASVASNVSEINRFVQIHQQLYSGNPDQWDALSDGSKVIDYMAGGSGSPTGTGSAVTQVGGQITSGALTATEVAALNAAGIVNVHLMPATLAAGQLIANWDPTFFPYTTPLPSNGTPVDTTTVLAQMSGTLANQILGASPTGKYVLLGLGQRSTMTGRTMAEPPVIFGDNPNLNPSLAYLRYVAVYQVSDAAPGKTVSTAIFKGALEPDDSGLHTAGHEVQSWYQQQAP